MDFVFTRFHVFIQKMIQNAESKYSTMTQEVQSLKSISWATVSETNRFFTLSGTANMQWYIRELKRAIFLFK